MAVELTRDDVTIDMWAEPDDPREIDGSFSYPEDAELVKERLADGNEWAWVTVFVRATWSPFINWYDGGQLDGKYQGYDVLGAVSAEDREDFIKNGGYYEDMVDIAIDELNKELNRMNPEDIAQDLLASDATNVEIDEYAGTIPELSEYLEYEIYGEEDEDY